MWLKYIHNVMLFYRAYMVKTVWNRAAM